MSEESLTLLLLLPARKGPVLDLLVLVPLVLCPSFYNTRKWSGSGNSEMIPGKHLTVPRSVPGRFFRPCPCFSPLTSFVLRLLYQLNSFVLQLSHGIGREKRHPNKAVCGWDAMYTLSTAISNLGGDLPITGGKKKKAEEPLSRSSGRYRFRFRYWRGAVQHTLDNIQ